MLKTTKRPRVSVEKDALARSGRMKKEQADPGGTNKTINPGRPTQEPIGTGIIDSLYQPTQNGKGLALLEELQGDTPTSIVVYSNIKNPQQLR